MSRTNKSREAYNKKAHDYENTMDGRVTRPMRQLLLNTVNVSNGQRVLDVACGTGDLIAAIAEKAEVKAYGIDIAEQMIDVAKTANKNISYSVSHAYPLPFDNSSMDIITVSAAFHHFEKPHQFADECMRVLTGGGTVYIGEFHYQPLIRVLFNPLLPLLNAGDVKLYSKKELAGFFLKSGFEVLGVERAGKCVAFSFRKIK